MIDETYSEYVIWGYPPGGDHTLLRTVAHDGVSPITDRETADKLKAWCEKQGATRCSIQHVTSSRPPDFTKIFR